ncbi:MAG: excinuclease ABC subunit UvrA [Eubacterium sp.]
MNNKIKIRDLTENNLKNISIDIPKEKITVFTGVSGSGKSSIVFDTIGAESQRQMNETYPSFVRNRMPKYHKPSVALIDNLSAPVIVDQTPLGGNARSTVGTISDLYTSLRILFSRIGEPHVGPASYFSFNNPNGMCANCSGIGRVAVIDMDKMMDKEKSWNEGCVKDTAFKPGSWYWKQYAQSGLFDLDKPVKDYTEEEYNLLLYGSRDGLGEQEHPKVLGLYKRYERSFLNRDISGMSASTKARAAELIMESECPVCHGKRLNQTALRAKIEGYSIADLCDMELTELQMFMTPLIKDKRIGILAQSLSDGLKRMIDIGLPYLNLYRESASLSGGEAQRLKLVRYMGSSLTGMTYIFDEPSSGMHPRDVFRMNTLLQNLRDKGNTVLVVEHDKDIISIADEIVDVGPGAGKKGGEIVFQGSYEALLSADTRTAKAMKQSLSFKQKPRKWTDSLPVRGAHLHNLKNVDADIPMGIMTVVTGVAGSGKSTLISRVFAKQYEERVVMVDQSAVTATGRSMPATYLGFFDKIRKLFAAENGKPEGLFSFNSDGACPVCSGKGVVVTELVFMDPIVTECESCSGSRYSEEALAGHYKGKNIVEVLSMTVSEALDFFTDTKIKRMLKALEEVGLDYMTLGQPISTLSGGERQRIKLAKYLDKKGNIYILDEPTTGLHLSDIEKLMQLFERMVKRGNTVIIIEHNMDVMKQADWIIDIGPDGGKHGGEIVFAGTPEEMVKTAQTITADCLRSEMGIQE